jgi:hypothetical protein
MAIYSLGLPNNPQINPFGRPFFWAVHATSGLEGSNGISDSRPRSGTLRVNFIGFAQRRMLGSHPQRHAMNDNQRRDATPEQKRGCNECRTQRTSRIEPAVTAKRDPYISLKPGWLPSVHAAPDRHHHRYLKQAAAPCGN